MDFKVLSKCKEILSSFLLITLLSTLLVACGGGSSKSSTPNVDTTPPDAPSAPSFQRLTSGKITVSGFAEAGSTVKITFADNSTVSAIVPQDGNYLATSPNPIINENASEISLLTTDTAGNESPKTVATIPAPASKTARLTGEFNPTVSLIGIPYTSSLYGSTGITQSDGRYNYKEGETVNFTIAGTQYTVIPQTVNTQAQLLPDNASIDTQQNLKLILKALDNNNNFSDGINLTGVSTNSSAIIDANQSTRDVIKLLYKTTGKMPDLLFKPSVAINTEAPQGDDTVGQAMPFVDLFKTARPFAELSADGTEFDENGWPTKLDPSSDSERPFARTKLLQGTLSGAIPNGVYTILYEGSGKLELGGQSISNVTGLSNQLGFNFDFILTDSDDPEANVLNIIIRDISPGEGNYIKNIRLIMPGGSCLDINGKSNPFIRLTTQFECPNDTDYVSFVDQIKDKPADDANSIIFNPDYLSFLREFKVIRMMNLMEASHGSVSCPALTNGSRDEDCITKPLLWENRAKLTDAVWGGNARTPHTMRNGVPIEIVTSLANTLQRDIWINMPHAADDTFVANTADYIAQHLNDTLKVYLEYANETWNPGFLSHHFVEIKGIEAGYDVVPNEFIGFRVKEYFARLRFYSERSVAIFNIWKEKFGGSTTRVTRVLGTNQGDRVLSEQMILNVGAENLDAIAMAPYFFGCTINTGSCADAPKVFKDAMSVDDVFDIIDQDKEVDPSALDSTINKIKVQAETVFSFNKKLLTYEGGQHLTTSILGALDLDEEGKQRYLALFKKTNRDPRMKERYETLLNSWKSLEPQGATLFTLYTLPQSYYRFGNWGLKEHLNKTRADSPKYDGVMGFQETAGTCWWDGCD